MVSIAEKSSDAREYAISLVDVSDFWGEVVKSFKAYNELDELKMGKRILQSKQATEINFLLNLTKIRMKREIKCAIKQIVSK